MVIIRSRAFVMIPFLMVKIWRVDNFANKQRNIKQVQQHKTLIYYNSKMQLSVCVSAFHFTKLSCLSVVQQPLAQSLSLFLFLDFSINVLFSLFASAMMSCKLLRPLTLPHQHSAGGLSSKSKRYSYELAS